MSKMMSGFAKIDSIILNFLKLISITTFVLLSLLITAGIVVRFIPVISLHWFDEIVELLFAYLIFNGTAALWISKEHFSTQNWLGTKLIQSPVYAQIYRCVLEVIILGFALIFFYFSLDLTIKTEAVTNAFAIPKRILYICMPFSGLLMIVYSVRHVIEEALKIRNVAAQDKKEGIKKLADKSP